MTGIIQALEPVARFLEQIVGDELESQGHVMTGRLKKSIKVKTLQFLNSVELEGSFLSYGAVMEKGIKPERIPYSPGNPRAEKSDYIKGLVRFVKLRRIATGKAALGVAFAIAKTQKKEGLPTRGSRRFSKTGKRRGFVSFALSQNDQKIQDLIQDAFAEQIEINIDNIILKQQSS